MNDDLFALIKSLDKNEKGYFKKFAARYGEKSTGNDYLRLFDVFDKAIEYNEEKFKRQLEKEGKKFNLSAQKKYLYEQIIRALRSYASGKSSAYSITETLLDIQNLIDKNLTEQAFALIYETQKKAELAENTGLLLQLKIVEDKLMVRYNRQFSNEQILKVKEQIKELTGLINTEQYLTSLLIETKKADERRGVEENVSPAERIELEQLMRDPVFEQAEHLPKRIRLIAYNVLHVANMLLKNLDTAICHLKKMQDIYGQMEMDTNTTFSFLSNTNNLLVISVAVKQFDDAEKCLSLLRNNKYKDQRLEEHRKTLFCKNLIFFLYEKSHQKVLETEVEEAERHYLQSKIELSGNNNLFSCYYMGVLFFGQQKYDKALFWIQKTIDHENTTYINVQAYCRLIAAIIHYEEGNISLMESCLQGMNYFMKKSEFNHPYLKNATSLISKLAFLSGKEKEVHLKKIADKIGELNETELQSNSYFHTLDLVAWAESKLNEVTYAAQLVKNNAHLYN